MEFTPRIKRFRFTFSFNTSSSIRVICYTFNCSSFEFSSSSFGTLATSVSCYLVVASNCEHMPANSGAGAWRGVYREDLRSWGNLQKINSLVYPTAYPDFKIEG